MKLDLGLFLPFGKYIYSIAAICHFMVFPAIAQASAPQNEAQEASLPTIVRMLGSQNRADFKTAHAQLIKRGQAAMPELISMRNSGTTQERLGAVIGLALMPIPRLTLNGLTEALTDPDSKVRRIAAQTMTRIGEPAASHAAQLLDTPNERLRSAAAFILKSMGKDAVPALMATLSTQKPLLRANAAWILGEIGPSASSAIPALIEALDTVDLRVLHVVAESIDLIGANPALVRYHLLLVGDKPTFCITGQIGTQAIPTLISLLSRVGTPIAQAAFATLAHIGKPAKPALLNLLTTGDPNQRIAAALLITTIDPRAGHAIPDDLRSTLAGALKTQ